MSEWVTKTLQKWFVISHLSCEVTIITLYLLQRIDKKKKKKASTPQQYLSI